MISLPCLATPNSTGPAIPRQTLPYDYDYVIMISLPYLSVPCPAEPHLAVRDSTIPQTATNIKHDSLPFQTIYYRTLPNKTGLDQTSE
jgi:hypothetical protein